MYKKNKGIFKRYFNKHHQRYHNELYSHREEFRKYHKYVKFLFPIITIFNILFWYLLFKYEGFKGMTIFFAVLFSIKGILELVFLFRLEKRMFRPIDKLRSGVEEIAKGNYNVQVEFNQPNVVNLLILSFNEMAKKLQESEKMKIEYEENRRTLIANISHDLKTPITSIQGYIEAIADEAITDESQIKRYLRTIANNTEYMNRLIDDLFLFSKLDMQKLDFQFENIPLKAFMNDLTEEFKFELEEDHYKLKYLDKIDENIQVRMDRKRMNQIFRNIIGNAVKYGGEKDLTIIIETYLQDDMVRIDIKDNGPGISKEKLPYIFDRFYRIDTERTKDFMSTGLGLSIAKELVEVHGGNIGVASQLEEGTSFSILLPLVKEGANR